MNMEEVESFLASEVYATITKLALTHGIAVVHFHKDKCPFGGIKLMLSEVTYINADLLRAGPYKYEIVESVRGDRTCEIVIRSKCNQFLIRLNSKGLCWN